MLSKKNYWEKIPCLLVRSGPVYRHQWKAERFFITYKWLHYWWPIQLLKTSKMSWAYCSAQLSHYFFSLPIKAPVYSPKSMPGFNPKYQEWGVRCSIHTTPGVLTHTGESCHGAPLQLAPCRTSESIFKANYSVSLFAFCRACQSPMYF